MIWKKDWEKVKENHQKFWDRDGTVIITTFSPIDMLKVPREKVENPAEPEDVMKFWTDEDYNCAKVRWQMANEAFPGDTVPLAEWGVGPGVLGLFLGSTAGLSKETVWYHPFITDPENYPKIKFDPENKWWKIHESMLKRLVKESKGNYYVGYPDIIENIDTLASLRDSQTLLMDMIERPDWVKEKVWEINDAFFETMNRMYDIIKFPDGSSVFDYFKLWSKGKVAKVQCDASAMFSPDMFDEFVVPALTAQCEWLDNSVYHLDGTQCICHLDHILSIKPLDAIEWTPQAGKPNGSNPLWFEMFKKIRKAGKGLQVIDGKYKEVEPLLDAIGSKGLYLWVRDLKDEGELEQVYRLVEKYK